MKKVLPALLVLALLLTACLDPIAVEAPVATMASATAEAQPTASPTPAPSPTPTPALEVPSLLKAYAREYELLLPHDLNNRERLCIAVIADYFDALNKFDYDRAEDLADRDVFEDWMEQQPTNLRLSGVTAVFVDTDGMIGGEAAYSYDDAYGDTYRVYGTFYLDITRSGHHYLYTLDSYSYYSSDEEYKLLRDDTEQEFGTRDLVDYLSFDTQAMPSPTPTSTRAPSLTSYEIGDSGYGLQADERWEIFGEEEQLALVYYNERSSTMGYVSAKLLEHDGEHTPQEVLEEELGAVGVGSFSAEETTFGAYDALSLQFDVGDEDMYLASGYLVFVEDMWVFLTSMITDNAVDRLTQDMQSILESFAPMEATGDDTVE